MVLHQIRNKLKLNADEKTREIGLRYFKESVKLYGVKYSGTRLLLQTTRSISAEMGAPV